MGHCISYNSFSVKTDVKKIQSKLNKKAIKESDTHSELGYPIRFIDVICKDEKEAKEYINSHDGGWYDNLAVKYYHTVPNESKKYLAIKEKVNTLRKKYYALENTNDEIKTDFLTCKFCKSKFNTKYYKGRCCPVCCEDIRSKTLLNKINKLQEKVMEAEKKLKEASNKELYWLVKIEYHV